MLAVLLLYVTLARVPGDQVSRASAFVVHSIDVNEAAGQL